MGSYDTAFIDLKLSSISDRCKALDRALNVMQAKVHASPAIGYIIEGMRIALEALESKIRGFSGAPDQDVLSEHEIELRIHQISRVLPYLHKLLALIENSDVNTVPAELTSPIRRKIREFFPNAEVIIVTSTELNYSIIDIMAHLRDNILNVLSCEQNEMLRSILRVSVPSIEYDQALLHCMIAHEIGHVLYQEKKIESKVVNFKIPSDYFEKEIKAMYKEITRKRKEESQSEFPFTELDYQQKVTSRVNEILPSWIQEIGADIFGLLLFGPAYLFASIHFFLITGTLDNASISHPPNRLRLRVLFETLSKDYSIADTFANSTKDFLFSWQRIAYLQQDEDVDAITRTAIHFIEEHKISDKLIEAERLETQRTQVYSSKEYSSDIENLSPFIDAYIPPCEYLKDSIYQQANLVGILNAGWENYLNGLQGFKKHLPDAEKESPFQIALRYNAFLLKSMELNEAMVAWKEASR